MCRGDDRGTRLGADGDCGVSAYENFAADIPPELRRADDLLTRYGRWATSYGARKGAPTLDRMFIREADRKESLEAWQRRREHVPHDPLMPTPDAMLVQRARPCADGAHADHAFAGPDPPPVRAADVPSPARRGCAAASCAVHVIAVLV